MGTSELEQEPLDMREDFHKSFAHVAVLGLGYSTVVEADFAGIVVQEGRVDSLELVAVALEGVVGILEVVVVRIALQRVLQPLEKGHNTLEEIVLKEEHNYTQLLRVEVDLGELDMQKES
jgi:hypothetical protein